MKFRSHGSDYSAPPRNTPDAPDPIAMLILMAFPKVSCRLVIPVSSALNRRGPSVKKSELLRALQQEIRRHDFNYFIDEPPSIAQGGRGVVVPGCPACKKRINTMNQFLHHLADDVMPALIERLSKSETE